MKKALYILRPEVGDIYGPMDRETVGNRVEVYAPPRKASVVDREPELLADLQILLSSWGCPRLDERFLEAAPNLEAVFYAAGSIRNFVTPAFWEKDIPICSAWAANAVPVAEFTLAQIILCLKRTYELTEVFRKTHHRPTELASELVGAYGGTVGLVSLGMIGRKVIDLLRCLHVQVLAYDPYVTPDEGRELGVTMVDLDELFREADVVSLHTPWLKETENMIRGEHFRSMKPHAAFINTARGAVVCEEEMIAELQRRPDLQAVLDVTFPEPPADDSPLWTMDNVLLTPHMAGSMGHERQRMGHYMVGELQRYLDGEPLHYRISREQAAIMA